MLEYPVEELEARVELRDQLTCTALVGVNWPELSN